MYEDLLKDEQAVANERARVGQQDALALQQPIGELSLQPIVAVGPQATIADVVRTMATNRVGCVLITDQGTLLGLFTERDVLRKIVGQAVDVNSAPVADFMTPSPETLPIDSPLVYALHRMSVGGYRHIPLLDAQGQATAVVSMRDIVEHLVSLYPTQILNLPEYPKAWADRDGG